MVVGGNAHGFSAAAEAFAAAEKAGAGSVRVLLPDSLQKTVGRNFPAGEFAPSTPSGSFSQKALAELLDGAGWSDAVLLAGDFGHNSETAILLEKFVQNYKGPLILAQDSIDYFTSGAPTILARPDTLLVMEFAQLQKLAKSASFPQAFTSDMDLLRLVGNLQDFTDQYSVAIMVEHLDNTAVAIDGEVSTTKITGVNPVTIAASAAVWWLQNPTRPFEATSTSVIVD